MPGSLSKVFWLGLKELASLRRDPVLLLLILYSFSFAVYSVATGAKMELTNASIAIADEDRSELSRSLAAALLPPYFQAPVEIEIAEIDAALDSGRHTFVIDIPPSFERDLLAGRRPAVQVNVDATAMSQAGAGARYIEAVVARETRLLLARQEATADLPVELVLRHGFNPNLDSVRFNAVMQVINSITILSIVLVGAAVIREREHGTLEHLLAMPVTALEVMLAKVWANGLVVLLAAAASLLLVVQGGLAVPLAGSLGLFLGGAGLYLFSVTSLGILLATVARTMPQFGLLAIPVFVVMHLLSGATTPLDAMPRLLQSLMQAAPSTHFVAFAQAVLYRGAGLEIVWPSLSVMTALGALFFLAALARFRRMLR